MQKKTLKVQPAKRIYQPKYPSFQDKNPLLYPETKPYPFHLKFINWASTGSLVSLLLLSGNKVLGQSQTDSLYYPFSLENARVPYTPVSFGTGMPRRINSKEATQAIRKAFEDSGITLDEKVWFEDRKVKVYLDGYSQEEELGFLLIDYNNMDDSFTRGRQHMSFKKRKGFNLSDGIDGYNFRRRNSLSEFIKDKDKFIKKLKRNRLIGAQKRYVDKLSVLEPKKENGELFSTYYLQYSLDLSRENITNREEIVKEILQFIDSRFEDSIEKKILFNYALTFEKKPYTSAEFNKKIAEEFRKLKHIESDEKFISNYLILYNFLNYNNGFRKLNNDATYHNLKLEIMNSYPLKKWFKNLDKLDEYKDKNYVSINEARQLDKKNKKGTQFIAPISMRDPIMIIQNQSVSLPKELTSEKASLKKEFDRRNGMTDEILSQQRAEYKELSNKYSRNKLKDLPIKEQDALKNQRSLENKAIKAKYKAMEQLTDEERAEFKVLFDDLKTRKWAWQKKHQEDMRIKTSQRLEEQVKVYINWARSQMGG